MDLDLPGGRDHPSWLTVGLTLAGYGAILAVIFVALFVVPFLVFTALA